MGHTVRVVIVMAAVIAASLVFANLNTPPTGHTGAPGEGTCADAGCHDIPSGRFGAFGLKAQSSLADDTILYRLTLADQAGAPYADAYGFQLTALDSSGLPLGELIITDSVRTRLQVDSIGRPYLSHTAAGIADPYYTNRCIWEFIWVRPPGTVPGDPIIFYMSGVLGDSDGTSAGDAVVNHTVNTEDCPVPLPGDVNQSGSVTSADVIALVGTVYKAGERVRPCMAAGDLNCDGRVSAADIVTCINFVFKGGDPACDVCPLIFEGAWDCI